MLFSVFCFRFFCVCAQCSRSVLLVRAGDNYANASFASHFLSFVALLFLGIREILILLRREYTSFYLHSRINYEMCLLIAVYLQIKWICAASTIRVLFVYARVCVCPAFALQIIIIIVIIHIHAM